MSAIIHEYELSIWKDVWAHPTLQDEDGLPLKDENGETIILDGEDILDEEKSAILSTDDMDFPGKAINIIFKTKINGTHELTFDLPSKYIDPNTGKKVHNYLRDFIDNETKVKLHYRDKWYCFHVKKVVEKREKNYLLFSYTCEDSFITELSKTGYKLTFNEYTDYYVEQIHTFGEAITEGSEWSYDFLATKENCDLIEYQEEKLVEYVTTKELTVIPLCSTEETYEGKKHLLYQVNPQYEMIDSTNSQLKTITIPADTIVYGFYSEINKDIIDIYGNSTVFKNKSSKNKKVKQIIYVPQEEGKTDGEQYILSGNTIINKNCNYLVLMGNQFDEIKPAKWEGETKNLTIPHFHKKGYYGLRIVYNAYTEYCGPLKRYVKRYYTNTGEALYSYTKTHVMVPEIATNYAANGRDMTDTTGWAPAKATDKLTVEKVDSSKQLFTEEEIDGVKIPKLNEQALQDKELSPATYAIAASKFKSDSTGNSIKAKIINTGPYSRKLVIDSPTVFALRMDYKWVDLTDVDYLSSKNGQIDITAAETHFNGKAKVSICKPKEDTNKDSYYKDIVTEASALNNEGDYELVEVIPAYTVDSGKYYLINFDNELLQNGALKNLFIVIEFDTGTNSQNVFCVSNLEFFEAWTHLGKHTQPLSGWEQQNNQHWADLAFTKITENSSEALSNYYIVPSWRNSDNLSYKQTLEDWDENSSSDTPFNGSAFQYNSAAGIYSAMMEKYEEWKEGIESINGTQYTLITSNSIVTGETFEEEVYFTLPTYQPLFADPVVYYCDPETKYTYVEQWYNNNKYRTLKQEKSNRFNLSQELSKLFKVYPVYETTFFSNGFIKKTLYTNSGEEITKDNYNNKVVGYSVREKRLYYTENRGSENKYGFKYGHNLNSISRTIDSTDIVTKMFVGDNTSEYAEDGICSIARAKDNIGKDNYLLNFSYFIDRKKIGRDRIEKDVYSRVQKGIYSWEELCSRLDSNVDNIRSLSFFKDLRINLYSRTDVTENRENPVIPNITIYEGFLPTIGGINSRYDFVSNEQAKLEKYQLIILEASVQTYTASLKSLREQLAKQKQLFNSYVKEQTSKKAAEYYLSVERIASRITLVEWQLEGARYLYEIYADLYNQYECEKAFLLYWKKQVEDKFNTRYESLLKEGVWQDSKYLEDNSYYLDAEKVLVDSCGPKITYTISVTDLSVLEKYKFTDFNIGDTTYVEDYEFFEDKEDSNEKYYQEKTIVSAITYNLDNPSKNTISLQNYTTKFDDLFSRITASVQSLTFNESIYARAGKFTSDGKIDNDTLQDTLTQNKLTIVSNQDVMIDNNGLLVTDLNNPSCKVKIQGTGICTSSDGGNSWSNALTGGGINADLLKIGSIDTQKITIFNENYSNFVWDKDGITAYGAAQQVTDNGVKSLATSSTYVRFNQYGLYFVKDNDTFETGANGEGGLKGLLEKAKSPLEDSITNYIMDNANVAITFNGFSINGGQDGQVKLNSEDGLIVNVGGETKIQVGLINYAPETNPFWGLYAKGAYIEGTLYSQTIQPKTLASPPMTVNEISRCSLERGRLTIWQTQQDENETINLVKLNKIVTFGASFMSGLQESNPNDESDLLNNIGASIRVEKEGKFWSVAHAQTNESGREYYKTVMIYANDDLTAAGASEPTYAKDHFYFNCNVVYRGNVVYDAPPSDSSDRRLKSNIQDLDYRYIDLFDSLQIKKFHYNTDKTRYHLGFIAQDIEESIKKCGLAEDNLAIVSSTNTYKSLAYTELLSLCVLKIKQLEEEIQKIKNSIK